MKKTLLLFSFLILSLGVFGGCTKEMGEKEYYDRAYEFMRQNDWQQAEANFEKLVHNYPNGVYSSQSLFMMGFINANYLKNLDKARQYYQEFLQKYPEHKLAKDAQYELQNLGKDIEDLPFIKGIEDSTNQESSRPAARK